MEKMRVAKGMTSVSGRMRFRSCAKTTASTAQSTLAGVPMIDEAGRFLGALLVACAAFMACGLCDDSVITESESPGGKYVASVVERNCGATTDYASHVRIRLSDSSLRRGDDVLVVDYRQS